jgi:hypothetical protein
MTDQFVPSAPGEARPMHAGPVEEAGPGTTPLDDPRALTILTTEHWGLLTARSLVYNEAFARAGMFLALLSATLVVLGLISNATGFSDAFLLVAAVVLALDLFVGLASLGRIRSASVEDIRYLQGMNRLRHAYDQMVPGLEQYVVASKYDDFASVVSFYGPAPRGLTGMLHGFTTAGGMVSVICCAVSAGLGAVLLLLVTHSTTIAGFGGIVTFVIVFPFAVVGGLRQIQAFARSLETKFPRPSPPTRLRGSARQPRARSARPARPCR